MRVLELWRFPVKSLQGERIEEVEVGPRGLAGDRGWAIFDLDTGFGLTARRAAELLHASARLRPDGTPEITLPDGTHRLVPFRLLSSGGRVLAQVGDLPTASPAS